MPADIPPPTTKGENSRPAADPPSYRESNSQRTQSLTSLGATATLTHPSPYVYKVFRLDGATEKYFIHTFDAVGDMIGEDPPGVLIRAVREALGKLSEEALAALEGCIKEMNLADKRDRGEDAKTWYWGIRTLDVYDGGFTVGLRQYFTALPGS